MKIRLVSVSKNISAVFYYTRRISAVKRPPLFLPKFRTRIGERIDTENFSVRIAFSFHVRYNKTNILSWAGMGFYAFRRVFAPGIAPFRGEIMQRIPRALLFETRRRGGNVGCIKCL